MSYGNPYDPLNRNNLLFTGSAVKAHEKVGALGASLKVNSELKEWTTDQGIDEKSKPIQGSQRTYDDPGGKLADSGRVERGANEWGPKGQPKASEQLKIHERSTKTGPSLSQGLDAAASVLNTLDMLTGGKDKIIPAPGYAMSQRGYNPEMYIEQDPRYA